MTRREELALVKAAGFETIPAERRNDGIEILAVNSFEEKRMAPVEKQYQDYLATSYTDLSVADNMEFYAAVKGGALELGEGINPELLAEVNQYRADKKMANAESAKAFAEAEAKAVRHM